MRNKTTEPTELPSVKTVVEPKASKPEVSGRNWRPVIIIGIVMFLAAFVRIAFSYSVSAKIISRDIVSELKKSYRTIGMFLIKQPLHSLDLLRGRNMLCAF